MDTKKLLIGGGLLLGAAALAYRQLKTIPSGVKAVRPFDVSKFLGEWYEAARFDYLFEKHVDYATAEYSLNDDGSIKVVNRGYNYKKKKQVEAVGRAVFAGDEDEARLKVSFWGPFYSGYNVIAIDDKYKYALVCGRNRHYLWILSRDKNMPDDIAKSYMEKAEQLGFDTSKLIWTTYN
ncbi:MAG TPA: lipocalin [Dysgonomonas sp.]|nr:lipocalin [Dysgonomonas sp.]